MTEQLDHKTFDLIGVLMGRDYPTVEIPVYFNETIGFKAFRLEQERQESIARSTQGAEDTEARSLKEIDDEYRALKESAKGEEYTVLLKSIDESIRRDIHAAVTEEYPVKKDMLGREEIHPKWDEEYTRRMWAVYIQKVTDPSGAISLVNEEVLEALLSKSPRSAQEAINKGIAELQAGPGIGFEEMAKDTNFLSDASPEG